MPARFARSEKSRSPHAIGKRAASGRPMRSKTSTGTYVPIPKSQSAGNGSSGSAAAGAPWCRTRMPRPHHSTAPPADHTRPGSCAYITALPTSAPGFASTASASLSK